MEELSGWFWFIGICAVGAIIFFFWWLRSLYEPPAQARRDHARSKALVQRAVAVAGRGENAMLSEDWNERAIAQVLQDYRNQPDALTHYVYGVRQRFIDGQSIKTINRRTDFLKAHLTQLQVGHEYATLIRDLERLQVIEDTKDVRARTEYDEALAEQQKRARIRKLEEDLAAAELEAQIAEARQRGAAARKPPIIMPPASPEAERTAKRAEIKAKLKKLKAEREEELKDANSVHERLRITNRYDDQMANLEDQLRDL